MPRDYKHSSTHHAKPSKPLTMDSWDRVLIVGFVLLASLGIKTFLSSDAEETPPAQIEPSKIIAKQPEVTEDEQAVVYIKSDENINDLIPYSESEEYKLEEKADTLKPPRLADMLLLDTKAETEKSEADKIAPETPVKPEKQDIKPQEPHFDFYTILPSIEVVVPEHEIKIRVREEKLVVKSKKPLKKERQLLGAKYLMQAGSFRNAADAIQRQSRLNALGIMSRLEKAKVNEVIWTRVKMGPYTGMTTVMVHKTRLKANGIDVLVMEYKE